MHDGTKVKIISGNGIYNNMEGIVITGDTNPLLIEGIGLNGANIKGVPVPNHRYIFKHSLIEV